MKFFIYDQLDSTQKSAFELLKKTPSLKTPFAVMALSQTSGIGRQGNIWHSPKGNLYISYVMKDISVSSSILSLSVGLCIHDILKDLLPSMEVSVKWPNDIYIDDKKISGVLIENHYIDGGSFYIIGTGINILVAPDIDSAYQSCCLMDYNIKISAQSLGEIIGKRILDKSNNLSISTLDSFLKQYKNSCLYFNKPVILNINGNKIKGIFFDIDPSGRIGLELQDKQIKYFHEGALTLNKKHYV